MDMGSLLSVFSGRLRRYVPGVRLFWRLERKRRLSGEVNEGEIAPHYHLLVIGVDLPVAEFRAWVAQAWYEVVNSGDERHLRAGTRVDRIKNRRHAAAYASKYAAKLPEVDEEIKGVRWWGRVGFDKLDLAAQWVQRVTAEQSDELRRLVVRFLHSQGRRYWGRRVAVGRTGYSVFGLGVRSVDAWADVMSTAERMLFEVTRGVRPKILSMGRKGVY